MASKDAFDPDAYLAGVAEAPGGEFDPNAYLGSIPDAAPQAAPSAPARPYNPLPGYTPDAMNPLPVFSTPQGGEVINRGVQMVKNMGLEGGGVALGQIAGSPLAQFGGVQAGGAIGGFLGNTAAQLTTAGKRYSLGEATGAAIAGTIPGASLAKAGAKEIAKQAAKLGAANLAATNAASLIETGKPASLTEDVVALGAGGLAAPVGKYADNGLRAAESALGRSQDALRRETLNAGRELGLVVPPAVTRPGPINNTLQSISGKAATAQEAVLRNQPKVNAAIRAEIGLPPEAPITPISLNTARVPHNLVYEEVSQMTPAASGLLENFKTATAEANLSRQAYRASIDAGRRNPALLADAEAQSAIAEKMRSALSKEAALVKGGKDLMKRFENASVKLAQIGLAERAANKGSGDIDAAVIGQALEHGERLTGNFAKIGKFQNAFGKYVQDAANTPPSGVDYLKLLGKFGVGTGLGYAAGGYPGAVLGGVGAQLAEKGSRGAILSPGYQRALGSPFYGPTTEDITATLGRVGTMKAGRQ